MKRDWQAVKAAILAGADVTKMDFGRDGPTSKDDPIPLDVQLRACNFEPDDLEPLAPEDAAIGTVDPTTGEEVHVTAQPSHLEERVYDE